MSNTAPLPISSTKPILKAIDFKFIQEWVPAQVKQKMNIIQVWNIVKREFCGPIVSRGVCPIQCERCKAEVVDLFRLETATSPGALLTWLAKDHAARWIEKLLAAEKAREVFPALETPEQAYNHLFSPGEETNLFRELMKDYELEQPHQRQQQLAR